MGKEQLRKNPKKALKDSFRTVMHEIRLYEKEVRGWSPNKLQDVLPHRPGDRKTEGSFLSEADLDQWILTKDSDWGEGYSAADMTLSPLGHMVLSGELSSRI